MVSPGRPTRARVATGLAAVALAALLAAYSDLAATGGYDVLALVGAAAVAAFAAGIAGVWPLVPVGLALLLSEYAASLLTQDTRAGLPAVLFATLFFVAAELAYWSLELRTPVALEPGILARRLSAVGTLTAGAFASSGLVVIASTTELRPSLVLELVGLAAAIALGALGARLARRPTSSASGS